MPHLIDQKSGIQDLFQPVKWLKTHALWAYTAHIVCSEYEETVFPSFHPTPAALEKIAKMFLKDIATVGFSLWKDGHSRLKNVLL